MTPVPDRSTFEALYAGQAPWDIGKPQKPFIDVADRITGTVLDAGCGTGDRAVRVGGVKTHPASRGRGFASATTGSFPASTWRASRPGGVCRFSGSTPAHRSGWACLRRPPLAKAAGWTSGADHGAGQRGVHCGAGTGRMTNPW